AVTSRRRQTDYGNTTRSPSEILTYFGLEGIELLRAEEVVSQNTIPVDHEGEGPKALDRQPAETCHVAVDRIRRVLGPELPYCHTRLIGQREHDYAMSSVDGLQPI